MNKPKWNKPKLTVLIRYKDRQERALQICKQTNEESIGSEGPQFGFEICTTWPAGVCVAGCSSFSAS